MLTEKTKKSPCRKNRFTNSLALVAIGLILVSDSYADRDYYQVLGVNRGASREDIKRAYKDLSMKFHPDKVKTGNADEAQKKYS
ncbi:MAG: hypothetical protein EZS28_035591, partial [Streblomastix strix]